MLCNFKESKHITMVNLNTCFTDTKKKKYSPQALLVFNLNKMHIFFLIGHLASGTLAMSYLRHSKMVL